MAQFVDIVVLHIRCRRTVQIDQVAVNPFPLQYLGHDNHRRGVDQLDITFFFIAILSYPYVQMSGCATSESRGG